MASDKERREVAERLRAMTSYRSFKIPEVQAPLVDIDDLLTALLGRRVYDSEASVYSSEALYLADLIYPEGEDDD